MAVSEQQGSALAGKSLLQLTWPLFIDLLLHFITVALNTFMLGLVAFKSVAALAVGNQVFDLCITLFSFISIGASVVVTQFLGAGDKASARLAVHSALGCNLLVGLTAAVSVTLASGWIVAQMNLPPSLQPDGQLYLKIIGLCLLPEALALCLAASMRAYGYTREAMYVTLVVNLLTVAGNALLLFGWFGLPQLGVLGVACSTVFGRLVGAGFLLWLMPKRTGMKLAWPDLIRPSRQILSKVLYIGLPAAGEHLAWMLQFMLVMAFVGLMGGQMMAIHSMYFQLCLFILLFGLSIGLGTEILIGHLVGAGQFEQAYRRLLKSLKIGLLVTCVVVALVAVLGPHLLPWFTEDQPLQQLFGQLFLVSLLVEPGRTFNVVIINALRATGDARFTLIMAVISMWGIAVPLAYWLGIGLGWGLVGIWLAFAADEWIRGLAMYWRWRSRRWQSKVLVKPVAHSLDTVLE